MWIKNIVALILPLSIFLYPVISLGQGELDILSTRSETNGVDTNYIGQFKQQLGLHIMTNMKFNRLRLNNRDTEQEIFYNPSENLKVGAGFFYKWLGLAITLKLPQSDEQIQQKGETESFDTQINLFAKKYVFDGYLQRYKGYYLENHEDFYPGRNIDDEGYPQRGDIRTLNIGANFTWIFNHRKFSYRSAYVFNEKQKKNAGSFIAGGFFSGNLNTADSAFVDPYLEQTFGTVVKSDRLNTWSFGLTAGYARTFIILQRFFLSFSMQLGPMYNESRIHVIGNSVPDEFENFGFKYILRGALGYNHDDFYLGVTAVEDSYSYRNQDVVYTYQLGAVKFFLGKRFDFNKSLTLFKKKIF